MTMPTSSVRKPIAVTATIRAAHTSVAGRLLAVARTLARIASVALACRSKISGTLTIDAYVIGRNGREAAEKAFSWDRLAELTERCYHACW